MMDLLVEFVFDFVLEGIFHLTFGNPKLKTWIKTVFFLLFSEAIAGLFLWISFEAADRFGALVCRIIALALGVGFLALAFWGHKRDWKQAEE